MVESQSLETITYDKRDKRAIVTLNRPHVLNAFNIQMGKELREVWDDVRADEDVRVIIVTATGRAFCSGADNRASHENRQSMTDVERRAFVPSEHLTAKQNRVFKPVITAVNGLCAAGGFYFVGYSDIVICSDNATFLEPHVTWGRTAAVEPILLSRRIPLGIVLRMALLGTEERLSAQRAYEIGLVSDVTTPEGLLDHAHDLADKVLKGAPRAQEGTIEAIWKGLDLGLESAIYQGLQIIRNTSEGSEDLKEGLQAFLDKREPVWKGR